MTHSPLYVLVATREGDNLYWAQDEDRWADTRWFATRYESRSHAKRVRDRLTILNTYQDKEDQYDSIEVRTWESLK